MAPEAHGELPLRTTLAMEGRSLKLPPVSHYGNLPAVWFDTEPDGAASSSGTPPSHLPEPPFTPAGLLDLELMHHWTTRVALTMSHQKDVLEVWQTHAPRIALKYDFLLHVLLSAAAFHLIHDRYRDAKGTEEYQRCMTVGVSHQTKAITASKHAMENITRENCHAVTGFAIILVYSAYMAPEESHPSRGLDPLGDMLRNLALLRGTPSVLHTQWPALLAGPFSAILTSHPDPEPSRLEPSIKKAFDLLEAAIQKPGLSSTEDCVFYLEAVQSLKHKYMERIEQKGQEGRRFFWPIFVNKRYMDLLEERRKLAMCVFAHYVVMMHQKDESWLFNHWATRVVKYIDAQILDGDHEMMALMRWPKGRIGLLNVP